MDKIKVAVVLHGLGPNGIDTLFANLAHEWDLEKFEITYFLAVDEGNKQFWEDKVAETGVRIVHITDLDGKKLLKWPSALKNNLKKYGPFDTIHVNMDMLNGINLLVAKVAGIPNRVCHSHVSSNNQSNTGIKRLLKNGYLAMMKRMMGKYSTYRIACSDLAGTYFFGKGNYDIVNNGIDLARFERCRVKKEEEKTIKIVTIGRIATQKNPNFLLEVVNETYKRCPDMQFYWVGSGELEKEIKEKASTLQAKDRIHFLGVRNDVEIVLAGCDYFLLPSLFEGLGVVLIEAQAAGLDCFVSDAVPELANCGKCKYISLEKDASAWADEIVTYIDSEEKMSLNREKISQFDIRSMARKLERIYSDKSL